MPADIDWSPNVSTRLNRLLSEIEDRFSIHLLVRDQLGLLRDERGEPLLPGRNIHENDYCRIQKDELIEKCLRHCNRDVPRRARELGRPFVAVCHKGTAELVVPVCNEMGVVAIFHAGAFRDPDGMNAPKRRKFSDALVKQYATLPVLDEKTATALGLMLHSVGQGILVELERMNLSHGDVGRVALIRSFMYRNSHLPVTLESLAKALNLSKSRTSHFVREATGSSFQELLLQERLRRAKALLLSSDLPLAIISERAGFSNEYYFSRQFKKVTGISPGRFRKDSGSHTSGGRKNSP